MSPVCKKFEVLQRLGSGSSSSLPQPSITDGENAQGPDLEAFTEHRSKKMLQDSTPPIIDKQNFKTNDLSWTSDAQLKSNTFS